MHVKQIEKGSIRVNGRLHYLGRINDVTKVSAARWEGHTVSGVPFAIEGGKKCGGSRTDWFLDILDGNSNGAIICTSFVDAITVINNA